jgi:hypothetical protein
MTSSTRGSLIGTGGLARDCSKLDCILGLLFEAFRRCIPVDANPPLGGTTWRRPISRRSRHRPGRLVSDRPKISVHVFGPRHQPRSARTPANERARWRARATTVNRFHEMKNAATLAVRCGSFEPPPPIPSVGPVARTWRIGRSMKPSAGSVLEDSRQGSREVLTLADKRTTGHSTYLRQRSGTA